LEVKVIEKGSMKGGSGEEGIGVEEGE